jgi:cyclopropane fatty-acyl-phospholipid synthase-like methyltransferase
MSLMADSKNDNTLTSTEYWQEDFWKIGEAEIPNLEIDIHDLEYRELHQFLKQHLPSQNNLRVLELGCHPGRFLWYFHTHFGYQVEGVEYVGPACQLTQKALESHQIPTKIHHADFLKFESPDEPFDIVFSAGLVEHFVDVSPAIRGHTELTKPGGLVVIVIPNHAGLNGAILKHIDRKVYDAHNHMSYRDLKRVCDQDPELEFVTGGYLSRFNLSPSNFFQHKLEKWPLWFYKVVFKLYSLSMRAARILPNTRCLSPNTILIARRKENAHPS